MNVGVDNYYECVEFGVPECSKRGNRYDAPKWAFDLLNAFNFTGYSPGNMKYRAEDLASMRKLVADIVKCGAFDLAEPRARLAAEGPTAVLRSYDTC